MNLRWTWQFGFFFLMFTLVIGGPWTRTGQTAETVLRVGSPWGPKTLDVHKSGYAFLRLGITETLVGVDENVKLVPSLARSWDVSDDHKTWTFNLREDVRFHNGTPFTAHAMKRCLDRLMQKGSLLKPVPIEVVEVSGSHTLIIRTGESFAPLAAYLSIGDTAALAPSSFDSDDNPVKPVGTGPFIFESWKVKEEIVALKNRDYWGKVKPKVDKVVYRGVPDAMTRMAMIRAGELDIAQILPPDAVKTLETDADIRIQTKPIGRCRMAGFNMAEALFADKKVRQAVNYAINRDDLVKYVLDGVGEAARTLYPPPVFWSNTDLAGYPYNPEKARRLLADAGWRDTDGDGILDKDGNPFVFKLVTYTERASLPPTAEVIQSQLKKVGLKAELTVTQVDGAHKMRDDGDFGMFIVGRGLLFVPDPDYNLMKDYFHENTIKSGWGAYHYQNARVDELLLKGRKAFDPDERKKIYDEVQRIIVNQAPMAYLNYYVNIDAVRSRVKHYTMHPIERSFHLETVEID